jgi:phage terminase small subunit
MNKPKELDPIASEFWKRHCPRLKKLGLLNEATFDSFVILCKTYSELTKLNPREEKNGWIRYFALMKWYQLYARGFGMSTDKVVRTEPEAEKDEFGL